MVSLETGERVPFESRHLVLERVAEGVWAALHRDGGWAVANAGIVDLGDRTLVLDAGLTTDAARDLDRAARSLTGRAPDTVALTHFHNDHARGTEVFADVPLVASAATRALLDTAGREELAADRAHATERLASTRAMVDDAESAKRACAATFVPYWEGLVASAPTATVRLPDVTFDDAVAFHGTRRAARLVSYGAAHTGDDAVLLLDDDRVVFCGDLLFVAACPYLGDGDPEGWLAALERLAATGATRFIPGHGPVGTLADVWTLHAHLERLLTDAERLQRDGVAAEDLARLLPDGDAATWAYAYPFHAANLRFLVQRLASR